MKKIVLVAAIMAAIIAVRMVLSVCLSEQAAVVFCGVAAGSLFFYFILKQTRNKLNASK